MKTEIEVKSVGGQTSVRYNKVWNGTFSSPLPPHSLTRNLWAQFQSIKSNLAKRICNDNGGVLYSLVLNKLTCDKSPTFWLDKHKYIHTTGSILHLYYDNPTQIGPVWTTMSVRFPSLWPRLRLPSSEGPHTFWCVGIQYISLFTKYRHIQYLLCKKYLP